MTISNEELEYEYHVAFYRNLGLLTGNARGDAHMLRSAEQMHALSVMDAALDTFTSATSLSFSTADTEATTYLRYGVGRRAKFIWLSLRELVSKIPPDRTEPLSQEHVDVAANALNTVYLNLRGLLDNFALCVVHLLGSAETKALPPVHISLFSKEVLRDRNLGDVAAAVKPFVDWNADLRALRDPVAHRIPLSVPPALLDDQSVQEYRRIEAEYNAATAEALEAVRARTDSIPLFEKAEAIAAQLRKVGTFRPIFHHHPNEGAISIYPTVPGDVGRAIRIARSISEIIEAKANPTLAPTSG